MNFLGRGRPTKNASGSNKSQAPATSSGKNREHTGGVSLHENPENDEHTGGASLRKNTECQGGASLTDDKEHEGGVSLRDSYNDNSRDSKHGNIKMSTDKDSAQASSSLTASGRFSQRHKATSISGQNMSRNTRQENRTPARVSALKSPMAPRALNDFSRGMGFRAPFTSQYSVASQLQTYRLGQSSSAPLLPYIASPPEPSRAKPGMPPGVVNGSFRAPMPPALLGSLHHPMMIGGVPPPTPLGTPYASGLMNTSQAGVTPTAEFAEPAPFRTAMGSQAIYNSGSIYNGMIPAHVGFDHIAAQNHSSIHSNIGPVPAGTGAHGQLSHGNHQTSHTNGAVPAQGNHMGHNLGVNTPHRGYQVGQSNHVANPNSNSGPPHGGNNLAHSNSAGVLGQNNITAPTPTNGGKKVDYWFNALTGEKRNPDGSLWTPHGDKEDVLANHSVHNQTEPRNFAPRPMGTPYMFPPPPNFNMVTESNSQIGDIVSSQAMADPFISPHSSAINAVNQVAFSQAGSFELLTFSEPSEGEVELAREWGLLRHKLPTLRGMGTNELRNLIRGCLGVPDESVLLSIENFPFTESSRQFKPATYGVIKISNIPFGTTRAEIIAMLGRNSKIISDAQEPVHIIMERVTSKTGDAFVEFTSVHAAARTIERHNEAVRKHRHPRLGDRPIEMTMSSQTELMEALFPWCRGVRFYQGRVDMLPFDKENPWNVFRGFVTEEEMNLVIKHVEVPSRSPYSKDCPQRPYESMISTLKKIPWDRSDIITLEQRQILFDTTFRLIESLWEVIHKGEGTSEKRRHENVLNEQLYKRLVNAAMLCPGFSVLQKDNIAYLANLAGPSLAQFNMPPFSECWTHLYNLCPRPQFPVDVLEFYIALIREETVRHVSTLPEPEQASIKERAQDDSLYFGYMWHEIGLPQGKELADMTLDQVAQKELDAIQRILRRAAANARNPRVADTSYQHQDHSSVI